VLATLLALVLAACAPTRPPGSGTGTPTGVPPERVRAPAAGTDDSALQVYRLRNSAVVALGRQAQDAEQAGDLERAGMLLERALRIDGRDAEILQQLAEVHLARGELEQAGVFAERARELGPGVGQLCERSLRTLMLVHERDGQYDRAWQAYSNLADCRVAPPARF
jgi:tetratricopeptide (TPR) repeat protein